jgi:hypothetical protein
MSASTPLPAHWQFYADHARETHRGLVDDIGYGREELLWETLAVIESGTPFTDDRRQRLDRTPWNRAKKHRRLRLYLLNRPSSAGAQTDSTVEVADSVEQVRGMLSQAEWNVEWRLAGGQTYAQVALDHGLSPEAMKVRAARWRARVRREVAAR